MKAFNTKAALARTTISSMVAVCLAGGFSLAVPAAYAGPAGPNAIAVQATGSFWQDAAVMPTITAAKSSIAGTGPRRFHAVTLNKLGMQSLAATAPAERSMAATLSPLTISLPHPDGGFQRFTLVESPIMEAELAAKHPEIKTYAGKGIDDPSASVRMDITPLGLHASVRSTRGSWYVDPYAHLDQSLYASYHARDLPNAHGPFIEGLLEESHLMLDAGYYHADDPLTVRGVGFVPGAAVSINVRNPETDSAPRQSVVVNADQNGIISATLQADPSNNTGAYEITASDERSSSNVAYHVVDGNVSPTAVSGGQLRTYRLALVSDPSYAAFFGGPANVTAAKVTLINRVTQVYEEETSIRLVLINNTDALNLNTAAQMTGTNGPCGGAACFTAAQSSTCGSGTLTRNRVVIGLLAGASNYDVGHIALGLNGGGVASLGVVGSGSKAQGCTGIPTPVGDVYAVDYVAHEMGHQFSGNHTFNGVISNCSGGNRNAGTSVEPGSGSSIMAYAGICGTDNLQAHSDAYWSQRSFDEITAYTSSAETNINEVQMGVLTGFAANGQQFQLRYNGAISGNIVRGSNYTTGGVKSAIEAIAGWPAGGSVTVSALSDTAFTVTFNGGLAGTNVPMLELVNCSGGCTGYVGEIAAGGLTGRNGAISATGNGAIAVTVPTSYTIPVRTPFALSGAASGGVTGSTLNYMWEQNDRGAANGTGLISNTKTNGPLFRQFGIQALVSEPDSVQYDSPGENHTTTDPSRVFPDMAQILANNTNALTGACPAASTPATIAEIACFSEFLPTAAYVSLAGTNANPASLNFKLTARDGHGGVGSASTRLILAPAAGPFLVTSPDTAVTLDSGAALTVTWNVANTNVAPVSTDNVRITLSTDGGNTFPYVLAASAPNSGSKVVNLPLVGTSTARVKVEAVDNVYFDVSNSNFTIKLVGDLNADGVVNCDDLAIVKASMGKRTGQTGFDARADLNHDGVVDVRDLSVVSQRVPAGTICH